MKINEGSKQKIIKEINFAIVKMKEEKDKKTRLYYFSAIYGVMQRIFNLEFNPDLVFAHSVISSVYNQISVRLNNPDKVIKIPEELWEKLLVYSEELLEVIENNENLYDVLKKFVLLGFVTMGNGFYLYEKGELKL